MDIGAVIGALSIKLDNVVNALKGKGKGKGYPGGGGGKGKDPKSKAAKWCDHCETKGHDRSTCWALNKNLRPARWKPPEKKGPLPLKAAIHKMEADKRKMVQAAARLVQLRKKIGEAEAAVT